MSQTSGNVGLPPLIERKPVFDSSIGLVENLVCSCDSLEDGVEKFSPDFQIAFPYRGLFIWHVGHDDVVADANQVLFVTGGEPYTISEPVSGECSELIITPTEELREDITGRPVARLSRHPLFSGRSRRAELRLLRLRADLLYGAHDKSWDEIAGDELVIALLRSALDQDVVRCAPSMQTRRLIRRAKEFLAWRLSARLRLRDVAEAVGASPTYLTDLFRRVEGVPLHKYVTQLRLARALVELPHTEDLTTLAFDLGFSSHSHFSSSFRRAFECTPSEYRSSTQAEQRRRLA